MTLYKVEFIDTVTYQTQTWFVTASSFCELGKKIGVIEKESLKQHKTISKIGTVDVVNRDMPLDGVYKIG